MTDITFSLMRETNYSLEKYTETPLFSHQLYLMDIKNTTPTELLCQNGYLTIKGYDEEFKTYLFGFPNLEVKNGLLKCQAF